MTHKALLTAGVSAAALVAGAFYFMTSKEDAVVQVAPLSTPPGITLQSLGKFQGYGMDQETAALFGRGRVAYADSRGLTLYTYAKDPAGQSTCVQECAETWRPLLAESGVQPVGEWSLVSRPDGSQQWALDGKPVYTYLKDVDPGSVGGNSPKRFGRGPHIGERGSLLAEIPEDAPLPPDWEPAIYYPALEDDLPPDISTSFVLDAMGLVLVNRDDRTLYVFNGNFEDAHDDCETPCPWVPFAAPQMAAAKEDLEPVDGRTGIRQWTYKGLGLYTYAGDLMPGTANGAGVDEKFRVAYLARNYMPSNVTVQRSHRLGKVLANANGHTLYRRDSYIFQSGGGHSQRRGVLIRAPVGRDLGTEPRCVSECEKWHPFLAPLDAKPQGDWSVYTRSDGSKQWAYIGYALWTYDGDEKPGDINADASWQYYSSLYNGTDELIKTGTVNDTVAALYWAAMPP